MLALVIGKKSLQNALNKMKLHFFTARRIKRVYYTIKYSFDKNQYYRELFVKKMACLCFIGFPYKTVSEITVPIHPKDLE